MREREREADPSVRREAVEKGIGSACRTEAASLVGPRDEAGRPLAELLFVFTSFFCLDYGDIKVSGSVWRKQQVVIVTVKQEQIVTSQGMVCLGAAG